MILIPDYDRLLPAAEPEGIPPIKKFYTLNGLYGILGYDSPDEAFADVVDYEIVDQLKWLETLRNQIGVPSDKEDDELLRLAGHLHRRSFV